MARPSTLVKVWLDDIGFIQPVLIGELRISDRNEAPASFSYESTWLQHKDAYAIDPYLPLVNGHQYPVRGTLAGIFRDSAPDRWGRVLIERRESLSAIKENRTSKTLFDIDFLLAVQDTSRMGGLQFQNNQGHFIAAAEFAVPPVSQLRELQALATRIQEVGIEFLPEYEQWLAMLMAPGSSLGGARPKANFQNIDGSLWIAKFPAQEDRYDIGKWEYLAHHLAKKAGIHVPNAQVEQLNSHYHTFCVQRFDRLNHRRRMYASAMTMTGKQDGESGSYLDIAQVLTEHGSRGFIETDLAQLFRRLLFNVTIGNRDDHLRNHGFLRDDSGWRLAPAFDVNPNPAKREHSLHLGIATTPENALEAVISTYEFYRLNEQQAAIILDEVLGAVQTWREEAKSLQITAAEIKRMESVFKI
ncbi:type II toxin-antitoxin system HipA family toxin [Undibacterium flavidum]|uniref:Type II toxin-antitoxin system HipA family toxin n=1 Tax=Undibacterium flavidum TaxID=2762297 RepID=A0ABR6Y982_9BURK|nr:HipA domain-containing protein [Undibacterium flavidum]MBC3873166.1 type II toxin-antitoxin system HipA family toxin [Undibacterium flavidum]